MAYETNGERERMSFWEALCAGCGTETDRRNQYRFTAWCFAWALSLLAATWLIKSVDAVQGTVAWLIALVPFAISIGALRSYLRFLRMADELLQKIQLEGLATGFGTGILFALAYQVMERAGAPELSVNNLVIVMTAGWVVGQLAATWRYR